jgi:hypothetical protein
MRYRSLAAFMMSGALAVTSLPGAAGLHAQAVSRSHRDPALAGTPTTRLLSTLSRNRAARWTTAARAIRCAPAPLTERPGIESEFARPRVTPLESAFADAALAKRSMASLRIRREQ